jgi:Zn finger protein HypA/HybF involved in hydrogenase expression
VIIADRCAAVGPGVKLNAPCPTCGHTMAAHTSDHRCDVCDVLLDLRAMLFELADRARP